MKSKLNESYHALINAVQNGNDLNEVNRKFEVFADQLENFSANEQRIFSVFRTLGRIRIDVHSKSKVIDLTICDVFDRLTALIDIEITTALLKLKEPALIKLDRTSAESELELLNWTDDKNDLVALIYGTAKSINNGKAKIKKIVRCFEYIFQIDLGNVYDALGDLNIRKEGPCAYLNTLSDVLMKKIDELNAKK